MRCFKLRNRFESHDHSSAVSKHRAESITHLQQFSATSLEAFLGFESRDPENHA